MMLAGPTTTIPWECQEGWREVAESLDRLVCASPFVVDAVLGIGIGIALLVMLLGVLTVGSWRR